MKTTLRRSYMQWFLMLFSAAMLNAQWTNTGGPPSRVIQCFVVTDSTIIAGTDGGLVRSTNNGVSWGNIGVGLPYSNIRALLSVQSYPFDLLAGMISGKISQSTNHGSNWTGFPVDSVQLPSLAYVNSILKNGIEFWAATERGMYLLPEYYPLHYWISYSDGLPSAETKVRVVMEKDGEIFIGTESGVYKRNGSTWVQKNNGLTNVNVGTLKSAGVYLFAGTSQGSIGGVYVSSDNGENWTLSMSDPWITSLHTIGSTIFAGSFGNGVWRSTNLGTTWGQINDGFAGSAYYVMSLVANDQFIFAGTNNANVWRRPLSQVTGAQDEKNLQPVAFSLEQNYPNPWNPSTTIRYALPQASYVTLTVYNTLGQQVSQLVNEHQSVGYHDVVFTSDGFSSGVYFYRIQAGNFVATKKLVLLR